MLNFDNKTAKQKSKIKSQELAKVKLSKFKKDDFDIEIVGDIKEIEVNGCNGIELFAVAKTLNKNIVLKKQRFTGTFNEEGEEIVEIYNYPIKANTQLGFGKDGSIEIERFRFFNPPILVEDENGDIETKDKDGKVIRKLKQDSEAVIKNILFDTIQEVAKSDENIIKGKIGNTTSTFYPSLDGCIYRNGGSFSDVRDGADGTDVDKTSSSYFSAQVRNSWQMFRGFFFFDTSAIGDSDTISSAIFSLYGRVNSLGDSDGNDYIVTVEASPASDTDLVTGDYDSLGLTAGSNTVLYSSLPYQTYSRISMTLNSTGRGWISKTGKTTLGTRGGHDIVNSAITGVENSFLSYFSEQSGTSQDPRLVVEHASPSSIKSWNGLAKASIKNVNGLAIASVKSVNSLE